MHKQSLPAAQHWEHICCTALTGASQKHAGREGGEGGGTREQLEAEGRKEGEGEEERRVGVVQGEEKKAAAGVGTREGEEGRRGKQSRWSGK